MSVRARARLASSLLALLAATAVMPSPAEAETTNAPAAPSAPTLDALLSECAKMPGLAAQFTEEKQIALLAVPLKSSGTVHFAKARGLVRHTTAPSAQSVMVTEKELVFWDGKATRHVSLASSAAVGTFASALTHLLTANRAELEKSFELAFQPRDGGAWHLDLTPKGADLKKILSGMELEGRGVTLSLLKVKEANGDVSTTRFSDVDTAKRYSDAEADRLFRVPPAPR